MEDLHKALDVAVKGVVRGGCNCGLTGFDVSFLRATLRLPGWPDWAMSPTYRAASWSRKRADDAFLVKPGEGSES